MDLPARTPMSGKVFWLEGDSDEFVNERPALPPSTSSEELAKQAEEANIMRTM